MTANLSDIAAMGTPRQIVLSVAAPEYVDTAILDEIYRGIKDQCARYHLNITWWEIMVRTEGPMVDCYHHREVPYWQRLLCVSGAQVRDIVGITNLCRLCCHRFRCVIL